MTVLGEIGKRLRESREKLGISQERAAVTIGSTRNTLALWEAGKRAAPSDDLHALAVLYGVSADYLLGFSEDPAPHQARDAGVTSPGAEEASAGAAARRGDQIDEGLAKAEGLDRPKPKSRRSRRAG